MSETPIEPTTEAPALPPNYRSPFTLAKIVTGAFVVYLAVTAWSVYSTVDGMRLMDRVIAGVDLPAQLFDDYDARVRQIGLGYLVSRVAVIIAFCFWIARVASNARQRVPESVSPGWAVGWFFIPIMNFFRPLRSVNQIWKNSHDEPHYAGTFGIAIAWWAAWIISVFAIRRTNRMLDSAETAEEWRSAMSADLLSTGVDVIAALLCLAVIWQITRLQERTAPPTMPAARVVEEAR